MPWHFHSKLKGLGDGLHGALGEELAAYLDLELHPPVVEVVRGPLVLHVHGVVEEVRLPGVVGVRRPRLEKLRKMGLSLEMLLFTLTLKGTPARICSCMT